MKITGDGISVKQEADMMPTKCKQGGLVCIPEMNLEHFIMWEIKEANEDSLESCQNDSGVKVNGPHGPKMRNYICPS